MTSKTTDKDAFVWIWLPDATEPVVAGKLESDDQGNVQFNYGKSYLDRIKADPPAISIYEPELPLKNGVLLLLDGLTMPSCIRIPHRMPGVAANFYVVGHGLDGVYVERPNETALFRWVKAPSGQELTRLAHTIAHRVGRFLERQGLLERDIENSYLSGDAVDDDSMSQWCGHSITYRIAVGPQAGRKVFTLQTLPALPHWCPSQESTSPVFTVYLPQNQALCSSDAR